jgi:DNA gyrase subunit A
VLLATAAGQAIRFNEDDARLMGRAAAGVKGIELAEGDRVIGAIRVPMEPDADGDLMTGDTTLQLLTICENGYGKRTAIDEYRVQPETGKMRSQSRGGKGRVDINTSDRNGPAVAALGVHAPAAAEEAGGDDVIVVSRSGKIVRMRAAEIRLCGRGAQGVRVTKLDEGDVVVAAARVVSEEASG